MEKSATQISKNRVKIHTGNGEKLAGLHSQIDFKVMCKLDKYLLDKNTKITKVRNTQERIIIKVASKQNMTVKEVNNELSTNKLIHPQLTKRSIIETALVDYFNKYPV